MSAWVGAPTVDGASAVIVTADSADIGLEVREAGSNVLVQSIEPVTTDADHRVRFDLTGLDADTRYTYQARVGENFSGPAGKFRTLPVANGQPCSFNIAFAGDAESGSNHLVFDTILAKDPLMFIHLGDLHYENISTNNRAAFIAAYDRVLSQSRQAILYREVPTVYVWDDHDFGNNNSDGTSASKPAAASAYRSRVPHYVLPDSIGIWHSIDVGRVTFLVTDQRSESSLASASDNSSKSMLGVTQKAWFKSQLLNSEGKAIVWICPRWFQPGPAIGPDHWGAFTTERTEIADFIKANCHGRVIVLSADLHTLGIDNGSNHDFASGGGEPLPCFQAAPLDQISISFGGVFSEGGEFVGRGQFGTMEVIDTGDNEIQIIWTGYNSLNVELCQYSFSIDLN